MVRIPLILRLKKRAHKDMASAQDAITKEVYNIFSEAVLHGGAAIWRCYQGNRFSEDLDFYLPRDLDRLDLLFKSLAKRGFVIQKRKTGENSLFSALEMSGVVVRLEALFKKHAGHLKEYEMADGNLITVYTLTPEELVGEKVRAYLKRRKIRDLYDVFFLLRHVKDRRAVLAPLEELVGGFKEPADETDLKVLITEGLVPTSRKMLDYITRW